MSLQQLLLSPGGGGGSGKFGAGLVTLAAEGNGGAVVEKLLWIIKPVS